MNTTTSNVDDELSKQLELIIEVGRLMRHIASEEDKNEVNNIAEDIITRNKKTLAPFVAGMLVGMAVISKELRNKTYILFLQLAEEVERQGNLNDSKS